MWRYIKQIFKVNSLTVASTGRRKQKLSKKEYETLLAGFRMLSPHIRDNISKLVYHVEHCHEAISMLEQEVRELKQTKFFDAQRKVEQQLANPAPEASVTTPKEYAPLPQRLKLLYEQGLYGSPDWERNVRYAKYMDPSFNDELALKIAKGEVEYNGKSNTNLHQPKTESLSGHLHPSASGAV